MDGNDEQRPLLNPVNSQAADTNSQPSNHSKRRRPFLTTCLCALIIFAYSFGSSLQLTPMAQITEDIICRTYAQHIVSNPNLEDRCKAPDVQSELSSIQAWQNTIELIPGMLVAVPYGALADTYGHKAMLTLSSTGLVLETLSQMIICAYPAVFPIRLLWASPIITLIGGGIAVLIPMLYAIITSVVSEDQRSTAFFYIGAVTHAGQLLSSPLVYATMKINVWLPVYIGFGCLILATMLSLIIPTKAPEKTTPHDDFNGEPSSPTSGSATEPRTEPQRWYHYFINKASTTLRWVTHDNRPVGLLLLSLLFTTLGRYASALELQYITKRYGWSWSEAGIILSARYITSLLLFIAVLPLFGNFLVYRGYLSPAKDYFMARTSLILTAAGAFGLAFTKARVLAIFSIVIFACGSGYPALARSIMSSLVAKEHIGLLYTTIGLFEGVGTLIAGPLLSQLFNIGLHWGGDWIGLPYFTAGVMSIMSLIIIWLL